MAIYQFANLDAFFDHLTAHPTAEPSFIRSFVVEENATPPAGATPPAHALNSHDVAVFPRGGKNYVATVLGHPVR